MTGNFESNGNFFIYQDKICKRDETQKTSIQLGDKEVFVKQWNYIEGSIVNITNDEKYLKVHLQKGEETGVLSVKVDSGYSKRIIGVIKQNQELIIEKKCVVRIVPRHFRSDSSGKMVITVSVYDISVTPNKTLESYYTENLLPAGTQIGDSWDFSEANKKLLADMEELKFLYE